MTLVTSLADEASMDIELLKAIKSQGDNWSIARNLEFMMETKSKNNAEKAASFIQNNQFGETKILEVGGLYVLMVFVEMPLHVNAVLSVSGFMTCIADMFNLKGTGWAANVQK